MKRKNLIKILFLGIFTFSLFFPYGNVKALSNYKAGALLKVKGLNGAAVYEIGNDGKKYIYPDQNTFNTWHDNFSDVVEVTPNDLDQYNDGGTVTFQPGTRLITHKNTAKVYAVGEGGEVIHIPNEETARKFYGDDWSSLVSDIDPGLFSISYRANNKELTENSIPNGSLIEERSGNFFIIENGQKKVVSKEQLSAYNLKKKSIIKVDDNYQIEDSIEKTITFEDVLRELPNYNMHTQHALISFKDILWDNDGISGGIGWGVYNTANSQPHSGSNYLINRHGANFLGFTFPKVVRFKGAHFAKTVSNDWMDINDPNGHSATKIRYHFYDENLDLIGTSDWFDLKETSELFPADIDVKRVEIEHDILNTRTAGFTGFIVDDAEWLSMDDIMYIDDGSIDDPTLPDITVIDILPIPQSPTVYATTTMKWRIKNSGSVALTNPTGVLNSVGDMKDFVYTSSSTFSNPHGISEYDPLNPGESIDIVWTGYFPSGGEKNLSVTADYTNQLAESNENNNTYTETINVLDDLPDLKMVNVSIYPNNPTPVVNASTTIAAYIQNRGSAPLTEYFDYSKSLQDFVITATTSAPVISAIDPLEHNETVWFYWEGYFTSAGEKELTMSLDDNNKIEETDETNNTYTRNVNVIENNNSLDVMGYDISVSSLETNASTTVSYYIKNNGDSPITSGLGIVDSSVYWGSNSRLKAEFVSYGLPNRPTISTSHPFNPGDVIAITLDGYFKSYGQITFGINVDSANVLDESDETNNNYTEEFSVFIPFNKVEADRSFEVLGTKEYPDGTLLRGSDNKIYVLENGTKVHISTLERLFHYIGQEIINVSDEILDLY